MQSEFRSKLLHTNVVRLVKNNDRVPRHFLGNELSDLRIEKIVIAVYNYVRKRNLKLFSHTIRTGTSSKNVHLKTRTHHSA
jgi:hypothetical protein